MLVKAIWLIDHLPYNDMLPGMLNSETPAWKTFRQPRPLLRRP